MNLETTVILSICAPAVGALLVNITGRFNEKLRDVVSTITTLVTFYLVVTLLPQVNDGARPGVDVMEVMPGVSLAFEVEPLGMLYALVASGLWIITSLYAMGYMYSHHEKNLTRFFTCFALAISAALGIAFAKNLFTLFLFYEVLTFSTFPLVTHHGDEKAKKSGRIYLGVLLFTSVGLLLLAVIWTGFVAGTLDFKPGGILAGKASPGMTIVLLALFAFGTGKAALMPIHRWLPAAMVAPTPVSALLHAVAVVKAGVFTVLKVVVYIFGAKHLRDTGASEWLLYAASFTILATSIIALTKDNLKARLAYSTISQLAYIVLGGALATAGAISGGALHIATHAVGKITLFFCAGAIYVTHHKSEISTFHGIGRKMPITMTAFLLGSLSIIGIPPFAGGLSKLFLAFGAGQTDRTRFILVLMASSLLSLAYLMPIITRAFFARPRDKDGNPIDGKIKWEEAPPLVLVPLCLTALGTIALIFFTEDIHALLQPILGGGP